MFSLCIPTMDRFDHFLKENLKKYLQINLIKEIVIVDENGNDYEKIKSEFNDPKIKLHKNDKKLGSLLNKIKVCSLSNNEWIVLIDSDNFADETYFEVINNYIINNKLSKNVILSPCWAKPAFDLRNYSNKILTTKNLEKKDSLCFLMNVGNYVINKYVIDNIKIDDYNCLKYNACDVIFFNTLCFEQLDIEFHIVENLFYEHTVHNNSVYLLEHVSTKDTRETVYKRFFSLIK